MWHTAWMRPLAGLVAVSLLWGPLRASGKTLSTLDEHGRGFLIDVWESDEGLPQNSAMSIVQTADGYLWVATFNGVGRFDGVRFDTFDRGNTPNFPSAAVRKLFPDRRQRLWASTDKGLACQENGQWKIFRESEGWPRGLAESIVEDRQGNLLFTVGQRILRFGDGQFVAFPAPSDTGTNEAFRAEVDSQGQLWLLARAFFARYTSSGWEKMAAEPSTNSGRFFGIAASRDGGLWLSESDQVRKFKDGDWRVTRPFPRTLSEHQVLLEDSRGNLWCGAFTRGLYLCSPDGRWETFTTAIGFHHDRIRSLFEDREGNIWVGTDGGGLIRIKERTIGVYDERTGLPNVIVKSVAEEAPGRLIVGMHDGGIVRFESNTFSAHITGSGLRAGSSVWTTVADGASNVWLGTYSGNIFRLRGETVEKFAFDDGSKPYVYTLYVDRDKTVWVGTDTGLARIVEDRAVFVATNTGLPRVRVRCMEQDRQGVFWVGTHDVGLFRRDNGEFRRVTGPDGVEPDQIWSLYADTDNIVWIGTFGDGLFSYRDGKLHQYQERDGLRARNVNCILQDEFDHLWLATSKGVIRVARGELKAFAEGRTRTIHNIHFTKSDGLNNVECSGGYQPTALRTSDGRLWFCTVKGLAVVDPKLVRTNATPPPVWIRSVALDGRAVPAAGPGPIQITVPAGTRRVQIEFTALSFTAPEKMRFQYMLEGLDQDWVDIGLERVVSLHDLQPRDYRFRVRAANNDGVWNEASTTVALRALPFYWQTLWFRILATLGVAALVGGVVWQIQNSKLQRQAERLRHEEQQRIAEARQRALLEAVPDLMLRLSRDGTLLDVSDTQGAPFPSKESLVGTTLRASSFPEEMVEKTFTATERALGSGGMQTFDYSLPDPKDPRDFEARIVRSGADEVVAIVRDITERKRSENSLKQSLSLTQATLESTADGILVVNRDRQVVGYNNKFLQMWRIPPSLVAMRDDQKLLQYVTSQLRDPAGFEQRVLELYNRPEAEGLDVIEFKDGRTVERYSKPQTVDGAIVGRVWSFRDITVRKQAEEEIRTLNAQLEQRVADRTRALEVANQELEAFSYSVSHDLRAPLRHVSGFSGLLLQHGAIKADTDARRLANNVDAAARKMGRLIDDLLAFSRMGRTKLQTTRVPLNSLVEEIRHELEADTGGRKIVWSIQRLPVVRGDAALLRQVLINLLSNAIKYTRPRAQAVIEVTSETRGSEIVVTVKDNGVGFDMRYADKLFGVFQRLHREDEFEGTGIGLANVRRIISRHGGRVGAKAELGQGATFFFTLPVSEAPDGFRPNEAPLTPAKPAPDLQA